jgi:hypothetical protein
MLKAGGIERTHEARLSSAVSGSPEVHPPVSGVAPTRPVLASHSLPVRRFPLLVVAPTLEPGYVIDDHRVRLSRHHLRVVGLVLSCR